MKKYLSSLRKLKEMDHGECLGAYNLYKEGASHGGL